MRGLFQDLRYEKNGTIILIAKQRHCNAYVTQLFTHHLWWDTIYLHSLLYDTSNKCIAIDVLAKLVFRNHTDQKSGLSGPIAILISQLLIVLNSFSFLYLSGLCGTRGSPDGVCNVFSWWWCVRHLRVWRRPTRLTTTSRCHSRRWKCRSAAARATCAVKTCSRRRPVRSVRLLCSLVSVQVPRWFVYRSIFHVQRLCSKAHTHTRLMAVCPGLPGWAGTRKVKPIWILLKQETVSGSGIS